MDLRDYLNRLTGYILALLGIPPIPAFSYPKTSMVDSEVHGASAKARLHTLSYPMDGLKGVYQDVQMGLV